MNYARATTKRKTNGPSRIFTNWGVGLCTLRGNGAGWHDLTRYAWAGRYEGSDYTAFQLRLLWFVVAVRFKNYQLIELRETIKASGYDVSCCMICGGEVVCIPDGQPMCEDCATE